MLVAIRLNIMKNKCQYYFLSLFLISILWILIGNKFYNNYAPFIFFIFGLPVFISLYASNLRLFSKALKERDIELFKKNALHYGYFKDELINSLNLLDASFEDQLSEDDLKQKYKVLKTSFNYLILCFISIVIIGILTVYF